MPNPFPSAKYTTKKSGKSSKFAGNKNTLKMNDFRTVLPMRRAPFSIGFDDRLLLIGSCFTENMGTRLADGKFRALTNPFGIVYNPVSMARCLEILTQERSPFTETDLFENAGLWHSWEHHGHFSQPDRSATLAGISAAHETAAQHLKTTNRLLLTFGTAEIFTLRDSGRVVANNHKMPAAGFEQRRLSVSEIVENVGSVLEKIQSQNPDLQIIITVSPVRHIRNGLVENQRSKATLLLACEEICKALPGTFYLPAYELLLDDLRDYRFYASDMLHPSDVAADYIWDFFRETFFTEETRRLHARVEKILTAARHRPFHAGTKEHRAFAEAQLGAIAQLEGEFPGLDFSVERAQFQGVAA
ncbi:MAG TPA: GSCFA domain-containing protein [Saprospiraceae bacterium]|nr:GSCFA domain-containing protein [Saprospiraceae bacterium]HPI06798.1 GSCFA domain-containing protein [Saprospiraceae bacterium]